MIINKYLNKKVLILEKKTDEWSPKFGQNEGFVIEETKDFIKVRHSIFYSDWYPKNGIWIKSEIIEE